jgi:hypothetical protein
MLMLLNLYVFWSYVDFFIIILLFRDKNVANIFEYNLCTFAAFARINFPLVKNSSVINMLHKQLFLSYLYWQIHRYKTFFTSVLLRIFKNFSIDNSSKLLSWETFFLDIYFELASAHIMSVLGASVSIMWMKATNFAS